MVYLTECFKTTVNWEKGESRNTDCSKVSVASDSEGNLFACGGRVVNDGAENVYEKLKKIGEGV